MKIEKSKPFFLLLLPLLLLLAGCPTTPHLAVDNGSVCLNETQANHFECLPLDKSNAVMLGQVTPGKFEIRRSVSLPKGSVEYLDLTGRTILFDPAHSHFDLNSESLRFWEVSAKSDRDTLQSTEIPLEDLLMVMFDAGGQPLTDRADFPGLNDQDDGSTIAPRPIRTREASDGLLRWLAVTKQQCEPYSDVLLDLEDGDTKFVGNTAERNHYCVGGGIGIIVIQDNIDWPRMFSPFRIFPEVLPQFASDGPKSEKLLPRMETAFLIFDGPNPNIGFAPMKMMSELPPAGRIVMVYNDPFCAALQNQEQLPDAPKYVPGCKFPYSSFMIETCGSEICVTTKEADDPITCFSIMDLSIKFERSGDEVIVSTLETALAQLDSLFCKHINTR